MTGMKHEIQLTYYAIMAQIAQNRPLQCKTVLWELLWSRLRRYAMVVSTEGFRELGG